MPGRHYSISISINFNNKQTLMKKLKLYVLILLAVLSVSFSSCDDDDNKPKGEFEEGVLVVNEGNFQDANGTISHISPDGTVTQDLFGTVNNGLALGDVVQSMTIDGDFAYIVVNNSNKMEVVNANTFEAEYTLKNVSITPLLYDLQRQGISNGMGKLYRSRQSFHR